MLWLFNLWNLLQGRSIAELGSFERRFVEGHALFYERAGFRYLGTYSLSSDVREEAAVKDVRDGGASGLSFSHAYVYLVDASSPKEAQDRIEGRSLTAAMEAVALERRSFNDTAGARAQLWLRPIILSTAGKTVESLPDGDLVLLLRLRESGKGQEDRGRAARRVVSRYSEVLDPAGWQYLGTYQALGLQGYSRADLLAARASPPGEARLDAPRAARDASALIEELDLREGTGRGASSSTAWLMPLAIPPGRAPER